MRVSRIIKISWSQPLPLLTAEQMNADGVHRESERFERSRGGLSRAPDAKKDHEEYMLQQSCAERRRMGQDDKVRGRGRCRVTGTIKKWGGMTARVSQPPRCHPERSPAESKDLVQQLGYPSRTVLKLELDIRHDPISPRPHGRALLWARDQPIDHVETPPRKEGALRWFFVLQESSVNSGGDGQFLVNVTHKFCRRG